ncbi:hypothetical protein LEP1GSC020_4623 [Leptospira interrogans serovar Grippotyphosa str. 2006006986]|uniref:Uncharacterized protein n=5 Tax=Leptospira TaxID=171 RepID=D4YVY8_LEPIN|nr:hypothetical protein LA_3286a [Leptospira interrogans serovar Lai str. 56601]AER03409.1 hypothetical protein LIF_A2634 [Leptospira interrogans serovar Lai str. IPAV]EJO69332.1 hypothetical protein LEP1GSC044_3909 [Leptospira kirschneri serovar Grippotyphosa str. RM52]EJP05326.1 hypothetical protein LEP1GSC007_0970 [Leptospira interrogans serovar Bulgarica str. Mallika]EJP16286.1 hypothetical protein LEP1GSC080_2773 [Leptospira interrogans str. FPW2026]EKO07161.1 hypothetical protein LEP1GSC
MYSIVPSSDSFSLLFTPALSNVNLQDTEDSSNSASGVNT